jgi:hypothetical protein
MGDKDGLRAYMRSYVRATLPVGLALAAWAALRGGSFFGVMACLFGGTVGAGVTAFPLDALRRKLDTSDR